MDVGSWMVRFSVIFFNGFSSLLLKIDCDWFLDSVFKVTDQDGNKVTDEGILDYIYKVSHV